MAATSWSPNPGLKVITAVPLVYAVHRTRKVLDPPTFTREQQLPVIVASADEADPEHPQAVGEDYANAIPGARLITDEPGRSPIAWQGSRLSAVIADVAAEAGGNGR